ncbi:hypothetical protein JW851_00600 [Candidatus Woesearchaeota archaeon]|nr:hypothetical protein [Candidatus Woesearchaeota archaeon]
MDKEMLINEYFSKDLIGISKECSRASDKGKSQKEFFHKIIRAMEVQYTDKQLDQYDEKEVQLALDMMLSALDPNDKDYESDLIRFGAWLKVINRNKCNYMHVQEAKVEDEKYHDAKIKDKINSDNCCPV